MAIVHLAGNEVYIGTRIIQRCLVCGHKLVDMDLAHCVSYGADGPEPAEGHAWGVGHLIEVSDGNPTCSVDIGTTEEPIFPAAHWPDSCLHLVEA